MTASALLPVATLLTSLVTALAIFPLADRQVRLRTILNLTGATAKLALVGVILVGVTSGLEYETRMPFLPGHDLILRVEPVSLLFATLSAVLWFFTTVYAVGYLEGRPRVSRFFGFFGLCVAATMGIALAGNLVTFVVFYEALTLTTYPLVVHRGTPEAMRAGGTYLAYTLTGGTAVILGAVWLHLLVGPFEFVRGGVLNAFDPALAPQLTAIFLLLVAGFGVKTALVPLHRWLPAAMVAPTPVSALLHAVAVVKAGAFGIMRLVFDVYGPEASAALSLDTVLIAVASVTILYGSIRALTQTSLKRLLAYSTVSQISYIVLGVAISGLLGVMGGLVHLVHQALMKITLFFAAGVFSETLGVHDISELDGVGRKLPWTMAAFTVAALGMIGLPPLAGFVSKWHLALGGLDRGMPVVVAVLVASSLLNAAYFLPIVYRGWFLGDAAVGGDRSDRGRATGGSGTVEEGSGEPRTGEPATGEAGTQAQDTQAPDRRSPHIHAAHMEALQVEAPDAEAPDTHAPDMEAPDTRGSDNDLPTPSPSGKLARDPVRHRDPADASTGAAVSAGAGPRLLARWTLVAPTVATALLSLLAGVFAEAPISPLALAREVALTLYPR